MDVVTTLFFALLGDVYRGCYVLVQNVLNKGVVGTYSILKLNNDATIARVRYIHKSRTAAERKLYGS